MYFHLQSITISIKLQGHRQTERLFFLLLWPFVKVKLSALHLRSTNLSLISKLQFLLFLRYGSQTIFSNLLIEIQVNSHVISLRSTESSAQKTLPSSRLNFKCLHFPKCLSCHLWLQYSQITLQGVS